MKQPTLIIQQLRPFALQPKWKIAIPTDQELHLIYAKGKGFDTSIDASVVGYLSPGQQLDIQNLALSEKANVIITRQWNTQNGEITHEPQHGDTPVDLMTMGDLVEWAGGQHDAVFMVSRSEPVTEDNFKEGHAPSEFALKAVRTLIPRLIEMGLTLAAAFMHQNEWSLVNCHTAVPYGDVDFDKLTEIVKDLGTCDGVSIKLTASVTGESLVTIAEGEERLSYRWATFLL